MPWAGRLLISLRLYRLLPPPGDTGVDLGQEAIVATWALIIVSVAEPVRLRREQWARERADRARLGVPAYASGLVRPGWPGSLG